jgi:hypothetical protein
VSDSGCGQWTSYFRSKACHPDWAPSKRKTNHQMLLQRRLLVSAGTRLPKQILVANFASGDHQSSDASAGRGKKK